MANNTDHSVPSDTPEEVKQRSLEEPRVPEFDPRIGRTVTVKPKGAPPNRLVVIGDSLSHGFQSGAVFNTDISYPAIIAYDRASTAPHARPLSTH
jgi:hypothetical protein